MATGAPQLWNAQRFLDAHVVESKRRAGMTVALTRGRTAGILKMLSLVASIKFVKPLPVPVTLARCRLDVIGRKLEQRLDVEARHPRQTHALALLNH